MVAVEILESQLGSQIGEIEGKGIFPEEWATKSRKSKSRDFMKPKAISIRRLLVQDTVVVNACIDNILNNRGVDKFYRIRFKYYILPIGRQPKSFSVREDIFTDSLNNSVIPSD